MPSSKLKLLIPTLGLAIAYCVAGKLALYLAIPPGFATAVWPAAGIAIAVVLRYGYGVWPGILIGSYAVNFLTSPETTGTSLTLQSSIMPVLIGLGASAQAVLATFLIRRYVKEPEHLIREGDIINFLVLAGPVSCLLNASWGTGWLFAQNLITLNEVFITWWTWWVGDTIGSVVLAPILSIWASKSNIVAWRRQFSIAIPIGITLGLVVLVFVDTSALEQGNVTNKFERKTENLTRIISRTLERHLQTLHSIEGFYASSQKVDRKEFHEFTQRLLPRSKGLQALEWNPRVTDEERAAFEEEIQREGLKDFRFLEMDLSNGFVSAKRREEYLPTLYSESSREGNKVLGFDAGSDPIFQTATSQARDKGKPVSTHRIIMGGESGFMIYLPIYKNGTSHDTVKLRRKNLQGYVVGVFHFKHLMETALTEIGETDIFFRLYDHSTTHEENLLYDQSVETRLSKSASHQINKNYQRLGLEKFVTLELADNTWTFQFLPTQKFLGEQEYLQSWSVLAGGLLLTGLLVALLLIVTGRTIAVEQIVDLRTRELTASEARFRSVVRDQKEMVCCINPEGMITFVNEAFGVYYNKPANELIGKTYEPYISDEDKAIIAKKTNTINVQNPVVTYWYRTEASKGEVHWLQWSRRAVYDSYGNVSELQLVGEDISEVKSAEQKIKASLLEKEILLREIHHRVKNNLQVISSLLSLQSRYHHGRPPEEILKECRHRVMTMALIHEKLYQSGDLSHIKFDEYLKTMVPDIIQSYGVNTGRIRYEISAKPVSLNIDTAIPCGLIVNEALSNSIKHAFPKDKNGTIRVLFDFAEKGFYRLSISDDGVGMEPLEEQRKSLGMILISKLCLQLEGKLTIRGDKGSEIEIVFPKETVSHEPELIGKDMNGTASNA